MNKYFDNKIFLLELPWDAPSDIHPEFKDWVDNKYMLLSPWKKLDTTVLSLIRKILNPNPKLRFSLDDICRHRWCVNVINDQGKLFNSLL